MAKVYGKLFRCFLDPWSILSRLSKTKVNFFLHSLLQNLVITKILPNFVAVFPVGDAAKGSDIPSACGIQGISHPQTLRVN